MLQLLDDLPQYLTASVLKRADSAVACAADAVPHVLSQVHAITAALFAAYENEYSIFCPMAQCFEVFGLDFIVDQQLDVHFLEINPGPDFKQTGQRLHGVIVQLWEQVLRVVVDGGGGDGDAVQHRPAAGAVAGSEQLLTMVYSKEWSAAKHQGGFQFTDTLHT